MDNKKKRLLIIALFGVSAITAVWSFTDSPVQAPPVAQIPPTPPAQTNAVSAGSSNIPGKSAVPVMPQGAAAAAQPMRDIFSPPAGYALPLPGGNAVSQGGSAIASSVGVRPVITGVIASDSSRVVLLRQGAVSRSYRVGDSTGSYQVVAIGNTSATLQGPNGTIILTMGQ